MRITLTMIALLGAILSVGAADILRVTGSDQSFTDDSLAAIQKITFTNTTMAILSNSGTREITISDIAKISFVTDTSANSLVPYLQSGATAMPTCQITGTSNLHVNFEKSGTATISILDLRGRVVAKQISSVAAGTTLSMPMKSLAAGTYAVSVSLDATTIASSTITIAR